MTPVSATASLPSTEPVSRPAAPASGEERDLWDRMWGDEGFSFGTLLDIINPLQHIPVVSTIYRSITGDSIGPGPRVAGGAIFGGVVGLIGAAADSVVEAVTGKDTGEHVMAMLPEPDPAPQWAANEKRGQRPQMAGLMSAPTGTQFATPSWAENEKRGQRPQMAGVMNIAPDATNYAATPDPKSPDTYDTASAASESHESVPVATANDPAESGRRTEAVPAPAHQAFAAAPRAAENGAGGRLVPLTTQGRATGMTPASLPSAQAVAADPAVLREMREGGAAPQRVSGRIDTSIKGRGLVNPGATAKPVTSTPVGGVNWLDYAANDPQATALDARAQTGNDGGKPTKPAGNPSAIPEVGPDFLMKMQRALDKYQAIRNNAPPSVDQSH